MSRSESSAWVQVFYRYHKEHHVFTSPDVRGLYVASKDPRKAFNAVPASIKTLLAYELSEKIKPEQIKVEMPLTFTEFKQSIRQEEDAIEPNDLALTDRPFRVSLEPVAA